MLDARSGVDGSDTSRVSCDARGLKGFSHASSSSGSHAGSGMMGSIDQFSSMPSKGYDDLESPPPSDSDDLPTPPLDYDDGHDGYDFGDDYLDESVNDDDDVACEDGVEYSYADNDEEEDNLPTPPPEDVLGKPQRIISGTSP